MNGQEHKIKKQVCFKYSIIKYSRKVFRLFVLNNKLKKKHIGFLLFAAFYVLLPYHNYSSIELWISSKNSKSFDKELSLRVYNSKDQKRFSDYYIYKDDFNLSLFDQPIWGFCIISNLPVISSKIQSTSHKYRKMKLVQGTPAEYPCRYISEIRKYNDEVMTQELYLTRIFSCILLSLFLLFVFYIIEKSKESLRKPNSPVLIIFFILSIVFIELFIWSHLLYPGIFDYDTFTTYHSHFKYYSFHQSGFLMRTAFYS